MNDPLTKISFYNMCHAAIRAAPLLMEICQDILNKDKETRHKTSSPSIVGMIISINTQLTFTCSKPTIETLKKGVKYVQS